VSNALAIASVSAVLKDLLNNGLIDHDVASATGPVKVSVGPPDLVKPQNSGADPTQLNLFLYQVTPNAAWRNTGMPSRGHNGERLSNPPLALDLHYLLTAYGASEFHAEILLGYAMQLLHETPFMTRDAIRKTLEATSPVTGSILPDAFKALPPAGLADQFEQIRITPQSVNTEEMSRLWSAMQAKYRPTAAYQLSVVLIEAKRATKAALPVTKRNLVVQPLARPNVEAVEPQVAETGQTIELRGVSLKGAITRVDFGTGLITPAEIGDNLIKVAIPAELTPGVKTLQVKHLVAFGTPADPHRGVDSNVAAFVLAPTVVVPDPLPTPTFTVARGGTLTLNVAPAIGRAQDVLVIIGEQTLPVPPRDPLGPATSTTVDVLIPAGFATGDFLLRLRVDGADSRLSLDPNTREFVGPIVRVTA
jgi:hypothetical protein